MTSLCMPGASARVSILSLPLNEPRPRLTTMPRSAGSAWKSGSIVNRWDVTRESSSSPRFAETLGLHTPLTLGPGAR
jgi:hypothetical protein